MQQLPHEKLISRIRWGGRLPEYVFTERGVGAPLFLDSGVAQTRGLLEVLTRVNSGVDVVALCAQEQEVTFVATFSTVDEVERFRAQWGAESHRFIDRVFAYGDSLGEWAIFDDGREEVAVLQSFRQSTDRFASALSDYCFSMEELEASFKGTTHISALYDVEFRRQLFRSFS